MNTATAFGLYILGAFALIVFAIVTPAIQYYTGGIVIALFIFGLFFAWGNAIRQSRKMAEAESKAKQQPEPKKEEAQSQTVST